MAEESYSSGQVARLLGIPARTARRYLTTGRIPANQNPITGRWTISRDSLVTFLEEHGLPAPADWELPPPRRVMVVDDDPIALSFVTDALEQSPLSLAVEPIANGYDALIRLGSLAPDLVILDSRMPGTDGREVLRAIKSNERTSSTRVLVVSGYPEDLSELLSLGADDSLGKPFPAVDLVQRVGTLLTS